MSSATSSEVTPELLHDILALEQMYVPPPPTAPDYDARKKESQQVLHREIQVNRQIGNTLKYIQKVIAEARAADEKAMKAAQGDQASRSAEAEPFGTPRSPLAPWPNSSARNFDPNKPAPYGFGRDNVSSSEGHAADRAPYVAVA